MYKYLVLVAALAAFALADHDERAVDCGAFPNGTATAIHWFECESGNTITVQSATLTDGTGHNNYPVDVRKPLVVTLQGQNSGTTYSKLLADVHIASWKQHGWLGNCKWHNIPTLGLLNNIDACKYAHNCPVGPGAINLKTAVDISAFQPIIALLNTGKPYMMKIILKNGDGAHEKLNCIKIQAKLKK